MIYEFIPLTDIAKYSSDDPNATICNWMRNRDTLEFLGLWESLHNPDFNHLEFEGVRNQAGLNALISNVALFGKTAKEWRNANPDKKGNMRANANLDQLLVLANIESP